MPKALAVYNRHLYYMDVIYEKLERVILETPAFVSHQEKIMENESDLKYFVVFQKHQSKYFVL